MGLLETWRTARAIESARREDLAVRQQLLEGIATQDLAGLYAAMEEYGWQRMGGSPTNNHNDFSDLDRTRMVERSRLYWGRDPMAKRAVGLYTAYALGRGMELRHKDETAQEILTKFLADSRNRRLMGKLGLRKLSTKLLVDGEVFLAVITRNPKQAQVRYLDPLDIGEIVTDPEDGENLWYFRRDLRQADGTSKARWYRGAEANWNGLAEGDARQALGPERAASIKAGLQDKVVIIHITINTLGLRGYPLLTPVLDWTKTLRLFMEDRATITRASAQFAFKKTVKGGASTVQNLTNAMRTGTAAPGGATDPGYHKQGPVAGSTLVQNGGVDTEQMRFDTGAGNAINDARLFRLQVQAGVGIPEHYFGDSANGNRATATSMERPVELTFTEYQEVLVELLYAVGREVLQAQAVKVDGLAVDAPPILNVDVPLMLTALTDLAVKIPAFNNKVLWRKILTLLDVEDVDAAILAIEAEVAVRQAQVATIAAQTPSPTGTPPATEPPQEGSNAE